MALREEVEETLRRFVGSTSFAAHGGVVTDLDGTVVREDRGRIAIPESVELALRELYALGRPLVLNSLRFPLSVMRTFGREWYALSNAPIPTVSLNGAQTGRVTRTADDELVFEEFEAFPLEAAEIETVLSGVTEMVDDGVDDLLVFYYPRDWRMGEIIWTPVAERVMPVKEKYLSASSVTAVELPKLRDQLLAEDICMVFLLVDIPQDRLMAYQHTKRSSFFTHAGVDKLFGTERIAATLGIDLAQSVGAGDTEMDRFLEGVGLAAIVGGRELPFRGKSETVRLRDSLELGEALFRFAELYKAEVR